MVSPLWMRSSTTLPGHFRRRASVSVPMSVKLLGSLADKKLLEL